MKRYPYLCMYLWGVLYSIPPQPAISLLLTYTPSIYYLFHTHTYLYTPLYIYKARGIHSEEVLPHCPSCHEVLRSDVFGFSLMQHMSLCCPALLARIEESVLPPIKRTRRGVMGALCVLCNRQFGLAGYGE